MILKENIPLAPLTTFGIGGNARYYIRCSTVAELIEALEYCNKETLEIAILSGGSNVLISDEGFSGCIIHVLLQGSQRLGNVVTAEAGIPLLQCIQRCHSYTLGGWEKLSGIPGNIGGALRGNVGAFGCEIQDYCTSVRALHSKTLEERVFTSSECEFSYRSSFFKDNPEWIIVSGTFLLKSVSESAREESIATIEERERRHLQNIPCAGSYFMNPVVPEWVKELFESEKQTHAREGRVPAGWLIDKAGVKGYAHGGAMSSTMHANYLVNAGGATAKDVREVARVIRDAVRDKYIVNLQEEPTLIGFEQ